MNYSDVSVVLPSLDPDEQLLNVVDGLTALGFHEIILVDDGSKAENLHYFDTAAQTHPEVILLHHPHNLGKGAALKTAITWYLEHHDEGAGIVTVDGDNQHHPDDVAACCSKMLESGKITLGCRDFSLDHVPSRSRFGNRMTSLVFQIFVGMKISDTQTGLRAIPHRYVSFLNQVAGSRFEYETNMLLEMKRNKIPFQEVPIRTVYIDQNKSSHFRVFHDSFQIIKLIFSHFFRYSISSLVCSAVDTGCYALFSALLAQILTGFGLTAAAAVIARAISSLLNFYLNKTLVFQSKQTTSGALMRYYALAVPQMCLQILLTQTVYGILNIGDTQSGLRTLFYVCVMTVLYLFSFMIQQRWVFRNEDSRPAA